MNDLKFFDCSRDVAVTTNFVDKIGLLPSPHLAVRMTFARAAPPAYDKKGNCYAERRQTNYLTRWTQANQLTDQLTIILIGEGGSVAEWLACWTQAQQARVQIAVATLSGNSLRQTAHTHCASVHQAAKLVAALIRVARVTVDLAESNGSLPPDL